MSGDQLRVQTEGVRSYAQIHDDVAAGLSQLTGAPDIAGVQNSHGAIAATVSSALAGVLGARNSSLAGVAASGNSISELLRKTAQAYDRGDEEGAERSRGAVE
jgi:hypothetical protein